MFSLKSFFQIKLRSAFYNRDSMKNKLFQNILEGHGLRHPINQSHHIVMKGLLKLSVFVDIIQNGLRMRSAFQINNYANIFSRFIAKPFDSIKFFITNQFGNLGYQIGFIYPIRNGGNDNLKLSGFIFHYLRLSASDNPPFTIGISMGYVFSIESQTAGWKIGTFDKL